MRGNIVINKIFQDMIDKMSDIDRVIGVINKDSDVVSSNDDNKEKHNVKFDSILANDYVVSDGFTYRYTGSKSSDEYAIFISGTDQVALNYSNLLSTTMTKIIDYYTQKHSKAIFIKNLIFENLLPGEIEVKARELKLAEANRVCILVQGDFSSSNDFTGILRTMFPDSTKDIIVDINNKNVVIVKELSHLNEIPKLDKLASSIVNVLANECYTRCVVGIGSIAKKVSEILDSFRCAQISLEVRNVFENEQSVALYSNLGIARLIYQLPFSLCKAFLGEVFKKCSVSSIDNDLMFTINKFFENSLNISETARKLFVHRNTLVYRIEKIKRITGLDLRNFEDAIVFKVALMVNKYLQTNFKKES